MHWLMIISLMKCKFSEQTDVYVFLSAITEQAHVALAMHITIEIGSFGSNNV